MKHLNTKRPRLITLLAVIAALCFSLPAAAFTGTEVAIVAGAAAAASIAVPTISTALTYSKIRVDVEVYEETVPLPMTGECKDSLKLSPDQRRSDPFRLGGSSVIYRAMTNTASDALTVDKALMISISLGNGVKDFDSMIREFDRTLKALTNTTSVVSSTNSTPAGETAAPVVPSINPLDEVVKDFQEKRAAASRAKTAMKHFIDHVQKASARGFSSSDLAEAERLLLIVRNELENFPTEFAPETADLFASSLKSVFIPKTGRSPRFWKPDQDLTPSTRMAQVVYQALTLLKKIQIGNGKITVESEEVTYDPAETEKTLDKRLKAFGFRISSRELEKYQSPEAIEGMFPEIWLPTNSVVRADATLRLTYVGVTVGANFGPIRSEAFQSLFSNGAQIDAILDGNKWKKWNFAESCSHAGDHNSVIYFDNTLTPVLKTATFDPSQFIAANAQLYKRVASSLADVYGLPLPTQSGASQPNDAFNINNLRARRTAAENSINSHREAMIKTLKELIDLNNQVMKLADTNGNWNADAQPQLDSAKQRIDTLVKNLRNEETPESQ
jgi:hypothetical protein